MRADLKRRLLALEEKDSSDDTVKQISDLMDELASQAVSGTVERAPRTLEELVDMLQDGNSRNGR